MAVEKKKNRIFALNTLEEDLNKNNKEYINLYFNKYNDIKVKAFINKDSFYVQLDESIGKLIDRLRLDLLDINLDRNNRKIFKSLIKEIEEGIEFRNKTTLSKVVRGVLGPLVYPSRTTLNYNVYVEMYMKKEEIISLDKKYETILYNFGEFIMLQDYIDVISSYENKDYTNEDVYNYEDIHVKESKKYYTEELTPKKMVSHIFDYIKSKGFIFDIEDIANFYLSMKVKPFVLLAGISGTGKSKLVELFANGIGATIDNGRYRLISVKPDWNDGTELFGYIDINGEYVPGILVEIVYEANKIENLNKPYIVCLDEMNLARIEYYLSDYLSIIETRHRKDGEIRTNRIFPKGYFKSNNKYADIYFSDNIILIGTVNMDDTTFAFSEKVLDRANTIEFSQVNLEFLDFHNKEIDSINLNNKNFTTSYLTIKEAFKDGENFVKKVNNKIIQIHNILKKYNRHFGYRTRDEIVFYMLENEKEGLLTFEDAFDYQISQKILPRINGSDYEIKEMLIELFNHLNPTNELIDNPGYLSDIKFEKINYRKSSIKIIEMLRSYENGYVSFW